jgi:CBS domain-containing protein
MLVKDLMTSNVVSVTPDTLVSEVAEILHKNRFTGLPVVNEDQRVLGTISERDFITTDSHLYLPTYIQMLSNMDYISGGGKDLPKVVDQVVHARAKDIMNQHVPFAAPDMTIEEVARLFAEQRTNPIPVTDNANKLVGVISRSDLIKFFSPSMMRSSFIPKHQLDHQARMIDSQVDYTRDHFSSTFAYVAKARANIWLTVTVVLFVLGFMAGIIYVADPNIFSGNSEAENNFLQNQTP